MPRNVCLLLVAISALAAPIGPAGTARAQEPGDTDRAPEGAGPTLTLEEAERLALRNNPIVRAADAEVELARAKRTRAARAGILPEARIRNVWGPIPRARGEFTETGVLVSPDTATGLSDLRWFTDVQLDLLQPIWTFGRLDGLKRAAASGVEAAEAGAAAGRAEVLFRVREAYWGLLLGQELLGVVEDIRSEADEAGERLQELFDEGSDEVTQNDMFKFEIFEYELGKRLREVQDRVALARDGFRAAVGLEPEAEFALAEDVLLPRSAELEEPAAYTEMALRSRSELTGLAAAMAARSSMVSVRRSEYLPQLFAGAQVKYNLAPSRFDSNNPFVDNPTNFFRPGVVVGFEWNLNFMHAGDAVRVERRELQKLEAREPPLRRKIRIEVEEAYRKVERARGNVEGSRRALRASENWFRAELQTFDLGVGEVADVIDAFEAHAGMRTEHLRNIFELNVALAELSKAVGRDVTEPDSRQSIGGDAGVGRPTAPDGPRSEAER